MTIDIKRFGADLFVKGFEPHNCHKSIMYQSLNNMKVKQSRKEFDPCSNKPKSFVGKCHLSRSLSSKFDDRGSSFTNDFQII